MAFSSIIRRGSASILPVAIRSVTSHRALPGAISGVLNVEAHRTQFLPFFRFSTEVASEKLPKADDEDAALIRVLESMIDSEKQHVYVQGIPDIFPFEIEYTNGLITLRREYQDEIITITPNTLDYRNGQDKESSFPPRLQLYVKISKRAIGTILKFSVGTSPHEFAIDSVSLLEYSNGLPELKDLNENIHKAWLKYLEIRGIKPSIAKCFVEFAQRIRNKEIRHKDIELLLLLKDIKFFVCGTLAQRFAQCT